MPKEVGREGKGFGRGQLISLFRETTSKLREKTEIMDAKSAAMQMEKLVLMDAPARPEIVQPEAGLYKTYAINGTAAITLLADLIRSKKTADAGCKIVMICQQNAHAGALAASLKKEDLGVLTVENEHRAIQLAREEILWPMIVCDDLLFSFRGIFIDVVVHVTLPPEQIFAERFRILKAIAKHVEILVIDGDIFPPTTKRPLQDNNLNIPWEKPLYRGQSKDKKENRPSVNSRLLVAPLSSEANQKQKRDSESGSELDFYDAVVMPESPKIVEAEDDDETDLIWFGDNFSVKSIPWDSPGCEGDDEKYRKYIEEHGGGAFTVKYVGYSGEEDEDEDVHGVVMATCLGYSDEEDDDTDTNANNLTDPEMPLLVALDHKVVVEKDARRQQMLLSSDDCVTVYRTPPCSEERPSFMKVGFCVLALSPEEISSCYQVTDVRNFSDEIREAMVPMAVGKSRGFGIQRYSWPRVSQGGSLIVVGHEASGKTWCYLPRLCDLVLWHLPNRGKDDFGPTSIILCEETSQMNMISGWVNDIFRDFMPPHTTLVVIKEKKGLAKAVEAMASPVGILLTTTELFLKLIELNLHNEPFLNPQSIKSLAIDNYGEMLRLEPLNIRTMLMWARSFFTFGIAKTEIYVATRLWDEQILRYVPSPMILFEDAMEATIYYGMQYEIYLVDKNDNTPAKAVLHRVLQVNLMSNRVVVACRSHIDVICVRYELQSFGISVLAHYKEDPASLEDWEPNSVLVITDEMMPNCRLGPVDLLIHYYCATTWFRFKSRYNILYDNCVAGQTSQTSFHIIRNDDYNYAWLMADFLLKHNMDYPDSLMSVVFQQRLLSDLNDAAQQTRFELCRQVLQYGDCTRRTCRYRHFMWDNEPVPFIGDRPNEGDTIYFRILQYNNPSSIGIRIEDLEHKKASLCDELQAAFAIDKPKIKHEDPENGDIVVIYHNQLYKRALVSLNSSWNKWVHVRVLDAGVDELVLKRHQLLLCPPQFKTKPYEAMDLRITGLAPATMERIWWEDMREDILKNYFDDGMDKIFLARVDFVLGNAVFVKDLLDCRGRSLWQYITPRYVIKQNIDVKTALRKLIHQRVPFPTVTKD